MYKIITRFVFIIILATTWQIEIFSQSKSDVKSQLLSYVPSVVIRYTKSTYHSLPNIDRKTLTHGASATLQYGAENWKAIVFGTVGVAGAWTIYKMGYRRGFNEGSSSSDNQQSKIGITPATVTGGKNHPQPQNFYLARKAIRGVGTAFFRFISGNQSSNPHNKTA